MTERYQVLSERPQAPLPQSPFHTWQTPQGVSWAEFFRLQDAYLLRFPGLADFHIDRNTLEVCCHPAIHTSPQTVEHLYLNQVLPLVQSKQGQLVFHAAAAVISDHAVVFAAESGMGKSTLTAAFALAGYPFLTDDGLVVEMQGDAFMALPSHPSIRLWGDSEQALLSPDTQRSLPVSYTVKDRFLADENLQFCASPKPLRRVYFLGSEHSEELEITPVKASDALITWVKHSFLLDIEEHPRLTSHFEQVGALARQPIHYRLAYPRRFDQLQRVMQAIIDHASGK